MVRLPRVWTKSGRLFASVITPPVMQVLPLFARMPPAPSESVFTVPLAAKSIVPLPELTTPAPPPVEVYPPPLLSVRVFKFVPEYRL